MLPSHSTQTLRATQITHHTIHTITIAMPLSTHTVTWAHWKRTPHHKSQPRSQNLLLQRLQNSSNTSSRLSGPPLKSLSLPPCKTFSNTQGSLEGKVFLGNVSNATSEGVEHEIDSQWKVKFFEACHHHSGLLSLLLTLVSCRHFTPLQTKGYS